MSQELKHDHDFFGGRQCNVHIRSDCAVGSGRAVGEEVQDWTKAYPQCSNKALLDCGAALRKRC